MHGTGAASSSVFCFANKEELDLLVAIARKRLFANHLDLLPQADPLQIKAKRSFSALLWNLTCSHLPKILNFDLKMLDLGTLKAIWTNKNEDMKFYWKMEPATETDWD